MWPFSPCYAWLIHLLLILLGLTYFLICLLIWYWLTTTETKDTMHTHFSRKNGYLLKICCKHNHPQRIIAAKTDTSWGFVTSRTLRLLHIRYLNFQSTLGSASRRRQQFAMGISSFWLTFIVQYEWSILETIWFNNFLYIVLKLVVFSP